MAKSIVLVQLTYSILYCSTYCLNLNGAAVNNPRALFMLRHYICNNKGIVLFERNCAVAFVVSSAYP